MGHWQGTCNMDVTGSKGYPYVYQPTEMIWGYTCAAICQTRFRELSILLIAYPPKSAGPHLSKQFGMMKSIYSISVCQSLWFNFRPFIPLTGHPKREASWNKNRSQGHGNLVVPQVQAFWIFATHSPQSFVGGKEKLLGFAGFGCVWVSIFFITWKHLHQYHIPLWKGSILKPRIEYKNNMLFNLKVRGPILAPFWRISHLWRFLSSKKQSKIEIRTLVCHQGSGRVPAHNWLESNWVQFPTISSCCN